jgi:agmatinase
MRFFDLEGLPRGKRVLVLPVPFEGAVSYGRGAAQGPEAFAEASLQIESYDGELGLDLADVAHFQSLPPVTASDAPSLHAAMAKALAHVDMRREMLLIVGGDHSVPLPAIQLAQKTFPDVVVLHCDAHADLRPSYEGSALSHACIMARVRELGVPVFQVGIRSVCREEQDILRVMPQDSWQVRFAWELGSPEVVARDVRDFVGNRPMYLSFDVDAVDPSLMPGTGTPEPGGLDYRWLQQFWIALWQEGGPELVGLDVCELAPVPGSQLSQTVAAKIAQRILLAALALRCR